MMTLGQRIAQKRKELGLSQEGLGEQLGVSRQAIYKWESDSSLPEIDKLITLSKIFSVSVGWLLGVEEVEEPQSREEAPDHELTETQLTMVQEIVDRYQQSQPKPKKSVWDKWSVRILFAMCGIMLALLVGANSKMKEMDQRYADLANSIGEVNYSVDRQINSITSRVESILKSQNNLTADWSAQLASTNLRANTATFDVRAVPKTYVEGMTAVFQAHNGEETVELPVEPGVDHAFSGQITCPLSDYITISVVFVTEDKRETQFLDDFYGLYTDSFPYLMLDNILWFEEEEGTLPSHLPQERFPGRGVQVNYVDENGNNVNGWNPAPPETFRVGLFRDRKLLLWYQGGVETVRVNNTPREVYVWRRPEAVTLESGHTYTEAAVYTDKYGRQYIYESHAPIEYNTLDQGYRPVSGEYALSSDPADWEF